MFHFLEDLKCPFAYTQSRGFLNSVFRKGLSSGACWRYCGRRNLRGNGGSQAHGRLPQHGPSVGHGDAAASGDAAVAIDAAGQAAQAQRTLAAAQPLAWTDRRSGRRSWHRGAAVALRSGRSLRRRDGEHDHHRVDRARGRHDLPLHHAQASGCERQYAGLRGRGRWFEQPTRMRARVSISSSRRSFRSKAASART